MGPGPDHLLDDEAQEIAKQMKDDYTSTEHILMAMAQPKAPQRIRGLLARHGIDYNSIMQALAGVRGSQRVTSQNPEATYQSLSKYGRDLTQLARQNKLDPVIGRDDQHVNLRESICDLRNAAIKLL